MNKFKVGDRVRAYGSSAGGELIVMYNSINPIVGTVLRITNNGDLDIQYGETRKDYYTFHPKQCRKVKPAKPLRTFFITAYPDVNHVHAHKEEADGFAGGNRIECVEVREVRRGKKQ